MQVVYSDETSSVVPEKATYGIIFCLPGNTFSGRFLDSFINVLMYCIKNGINFIVSRQEDSVVYYVRNKCLGGSVLRGEKQLPFDGKINYTHIMWIDSDTIFSVKHFEALLKHSDLDIVAGVYSMADGRHYAAVEQWDEEYFQKNGTFRFLPIEEFKDKKGLMEMVYSGFGFVLVKKGVFETVGYPWFRPIFHSIGEDIKDFSSEDVSFCLCAREKGFKIFIDPEIRVGHEKKMIL
jgi:hypothetical protein